MDLLILPMNLEELVETDLQGADMNVGVMCFLGHSFDVIGFNAPEIWEPFLYASVPLCWATGAG